MKEIIKHIKIILILNLIALVVYLPTAYLAHFVSFGFAMLLAIIGSGVASIFVSFQIDKIFGKVLRRGIVGFVFEMILVIAVWYFLYSFIALQQGKVTPLINPSAVSDYKDYTFFHLNNYEYDDSKIVHYQRLQKDNEGTKSYTTYYACPIINQANNTYNSDLWLGYKKSGKISSTSFFEKELESKYEYYAKYVIEQTSFQEAIKKKVSKEVGDKSIIVYGVSSPESAKEEAWNNIFYAILTVNILFLIVWAVTSLFDDRVEV